MPLENPFNPGEKITPDRIRVTPVEALDDPPLVKILKTMAHEFDDDGWDHPARLFGIQIMEGVGAAMAYLAPPIPLNLHPAEAIKILLTVKGPLEDKWMAVILVSEIWQYSKESQEKFTAALNAKAKELGVEKSEVKDLAGTSYAELLGFSPSQDPHRIESRLMLGIDRHDNAAQLMHARGSKEEPEAEFYEAPSSKVLSGRVPEALRSLLEIS